MDRNPQDTEKMRGWRENFAGFCSELMHVEHRDIPGMLVRLVPNRAQAHFIEQVSRAVNLNIRMQIDVARAGHESYIPNLLRRVEQGRPVLWHEVGTRILYDKSRHAGVTSICIALAEQRLQFVSRYPALLMAHDQDAAEEIFRKRVVMFDNWPTEWLHLRGTPEYDSIDRVQFPGGGRVSVRTAGVRGKRARTRGWHFKFYHFSEYAHYETHTDVKACMQIAPPSAWVIKESTANGRSGPFWNEWNQALTVEEAERAYENRDIETLKAWGIPNHQYKIFFPWLDDPGLTAPVFEWERSLYEDDLDEYERALKTRFPDKFPPEKVKWRRAKIQADCQGQDLEPTAYFAQEFPATAEESFQATGSCVFSPSALDIMEVKSKQHPAILQARLTGLGAPEKPLLGGANFFAYETPKRGRSYVLGADTAQGIGSDSHFLVIFDQHDGTFFEEVAAFYSNTIDAKAFGHVVTLVAEIYNNAFITPEIQGGGLATCMTIVNDNRYMRIYQRKTLDAISNTEETNIFRYGIFTSHQVKDAIVNNLRNIVEERRISIKTPRLLQEMRAFKQEHGKYSAPEGEHDDGVMAACLGIFGARWAPSPRQAEAEAKKAASEEETADKYMMAVLRAVQKKVERSMRRAKKQPGYRPGIDKSKKTPITSAPAR